MASLLPKFAPLRRVSSRAFSAQAPAVAQIRIPVEESRSTVLDNGLTLYSLENQSPVSRIVVVTRAGARYEKDETIGASHMIRSLAGSRTQNSTGFAITKNIEWVGGNLYTAATRDHIIYTLECNRDYVATAAKFLNDVAFAPQFRNYLIEDNTPRLLRELASFQQNQGAILLDALHAASFRGGLANSLFVHPSMVGSYSEELLTDYYKNHVTGPRTVVSAIGVDHERLVHIFKKLENIRSSSTDNGRPAKFNPNGGEVRVEFAAENTMVALAMESCGLANPKDALAMEVLKHVLGMSKLRVPFGNYGNTRLGKAVLASKPQNPFAIGAFTSNYSDTGMFGVALSANNKEVESVSRAAVLAVRDVGKGNLNAAEVEGAKQKAKYAIAKRMSKHTKIATMIAVQHLTQGKPQPFEDSMAMIDSITQADITNIAQKMTRVKPSMAVVGRLSNAPHVDELLQ